MDRLIEEFISTTNRNIEITLENHKLKKDLQELEIKNQELAFSTITIEQLKRYFMTFTGSNQVYVNDDMNEELYNILVGK